MNQALLMLCSLIVDEVMEQATLHQLSISKFVRSASPVAIRKRVYRKVRTQLPDVLARLVEDLKPNVGELVDVNEIIVEKLSNAHIEAACPID